MFPNFKNLSDRQRKHRALLEQANNSILIDNQKQNAYAQTFWTGDDVGIDALKQRQENGTQTDVTMDYASSPTYQRPTTDVVMSDAPVVTTRPTMVSSGTQFRPTMVSSGTQADAQPSEYQQMLEEDLRSHIVNHNDRISRLYEDATRMFQSLAVEYEQLSGSHRLSRMEINAVRSDFERGRQMYMNLQQHATNLQEENELLQTNHQNVVEQNQNLTRDNQYLRHDNQQLKDFKRADGQRVEAEVYNELNQGYQQLGELYTALHDGYNILKKNSDESAAQYEATIKELKRVGAINTARVLEMNEKLLRSTVSANTSRNTRASTNTPQSLKEYMESRGLNETFAASNTGVVSRKFKFVIMNGRLFRRNMDNGQDNDLEENGSERYYKSFNFVWTIIGIKHAKGAGYKMHTQSLLKQEYDAIMESGKLPTHEDARQARVNMSNARGNLPALDDLLPDYEELIDEEKPLFPTQKNKTKRSASVSTVPVGLRPRRASDFADARKNLPGLADPNSIAVRTPEPKRNRGTSFYDTITPPPLATKRIHRGTGIMLRGKILVGRGLMGAGKFSKKVLCKNLAQIEGSGTASDLKYKRVGTKFIRVKDLYENKLKLVYPNRSGVTPIRTITPALSNLIKELVFDKNINQQSFENLTIDDQRLFHDIIKAAHLQYTFKTPLVEPRERLQAEFDKLRGELMLGNDNPDLIKELKTLSIDLYTQKLLSDTEFKEILSSLI